MLELWMISTPTLQLLVEELRKAGEANYQGGTCSDGHKAYWQAARAIGRELEDRLGRPEPREAKAPTRGPDGHFIEID